MPPGEVRLDRSLEALCRLFMQEGGSTVQALVVVTGLDRAGPKERQPRVGRVDGAVRPKKRNVGDLARRKLRGGSRVVLALEAYHPMAPKGLGWHKGNPSGDQDVREISRPFAWR